MTRITGTLYKDVSIFMIISLWVLLRTSNISNKSCRENQNAHFMLSKFFPENCAVYEIMSKNMFEPEWPQVTISNLIEVFRDFSSVVRWMPGYNLKKGHGPHSPSGTAVSPMFLPVFASLRLRLRHSGFESQKDLRPKYAPPPPQEWESQHARSWS